MRRLSRLDRSIALPYPKSTSSPFLCALCRQRPTASSSSIPPAARFKSSVPYTENIRKRIWGTETPPGQEDPYGGESVLDQTKTTKEARQHEEKADAVKPPAVSAADLESYEPATSWDGLEEIGEVGNWWSSDVVHEKFDGFVPAQRLTDPGELIAALHRTVVEVYTLRQADLPLSWISNGSVNSDITSSVQIVQSQAEYGGVLQFPAEGLQRDIVQSLSPLNSEPTESEQDIEADRSPVNTVEPVAPKIDETAVHDAPTVSEEDVAADRSSVDPLQVEKIGLKAAGLQAQAASWDPIWLKISLDDSAVKFAVFKRIMQLTGIRIPDSAIKYVHTVDDVLGHLITPPKPLKLVDELVRRPDLVNLPNVKIYDRRVTPIDREISVGRWKIIEKELERRGLPVTGH